jgi:hypothetical protein
MFKGFKRFLQQEIAAQLSNHELNIYQATNACRQEIAKTKLDVITELKQAADRHWQMQEMVAQLQTKLTDLTRRQDDTERTCDTPAA